MANLLRMLCTKFYQNRPSFEEDITETRWLTFMYWTLRRVRQFQFNSQLSAVNRIIVASLICVEAFNVFFTDVSERY